jgi:thymidylate synthase (FAD)
MGQVKLKVELLKYTDNPEELVALAAKLCYSSQRIDELKSGVGKNDQKKFIKKLMELGHMSPVEHCSFTFGVEGVSRALLAQITRHRIASFSVKSQRYVKEGSIDKTFDYIIPPSISEKGIELQEKFTAQMNQIQSWYNEWIEVLGDQGESSNQDARFVLPNAASTSFIFTMNCRELLWFLQLRCCNRAQWEIRELALEILKLVKQVAPTLFEFAGPSCVWDKCKEGKLTCGKQIEVREMYRKL